MYKLFKNILDDACFILETYKGRDKLIRTICYVTRIVAETQNNPEYAKKFSNLSSVMSQTRATLRIFDDIQMLKCNLDYGFGKSEPDRLMALLGVVTNFLDQAYLPIEKLSWLAEHQLISGVNKSKWDTASSICWVVTTYLSILKTLRYIFVLEKHKKCVPHDARAVLEKLLSMEKYQILMLIRLVIDFVHAVSTLPPGYLWSSKLKKLHIGVIGTISSVLGIYLIIYKRSLS